MSPTTRRSRQENFRRLLAQHEPDVFKDFPFFHPLRRLERKTRWRAWIGTWWPWAAGMIGKWWERQAQRASCDIREGCFEVRGHLGPCQTFCVYCGEEVTAGDPHACSGDWEDYVQSILDV